MVTNKGKDKVTSNTVTFEHKRTAPDGSDLNYTISVDTTGATEDDLRAPASYYIAELWSHRNTSSQAYKKPENVDAAKELKVTKKVTINFLEELSRTSIRTVQSTPDALIRKAEKAETPEERKELLSAAKAKLEYYRDLLTKAEGKK